jgi:hypothetical protein
MADYATLICPTSLTASIGPLAMNKSPWDIRDPSPRGDADENTIFNAVGRALTEWEYVETACARLFAVFVSAHQRKTYHAPAVRAYGCVISFKSKSEMLRLAAAAYFDKRKTKRTAFEQRLKHLLTDYNNYSDRRNEIAHGCVKSVFITERTNKKGRRPGGIGLYLLPSFYNPRKFKMEQFTYRYTSSDLIHYRQEFTKLHLRIDALRESMQRSSSP